MRRSRLTFITIVPSPYQRDLLAALAERDEVDLQVIYLECASPDSPWPEMPLRPYERVADGFWVPLSNARLHVNWGLPDMTSSDLVVLSSFSSLTGQELMRSRLRGRRWLFWGERLREQPNGWRRHLQQVMIAPLAQASGIVGMGRGATGDYARRFPAVPTFSIPYHCDIGSFLSIDRAVNPGQPVTFLFCGQMIERKGVDLLLRAFTRLVTKGVDAQLLLVGREADLPRFLSAITPVARARVTYEGFQAPEDLPRYFAQADVFVIPSRHDGWGVVVNQALAAGLPVITSNAVGAGMDLVDEGVNGTVFASGDVDALEARLTLLAGNTERIRQWGAAARQRAAALTPEAGAAKWIEVIRCVVEEPAGRVG